MFKGSAYFRRRVMYSTGRDSNGRAKLAGHSMTGYFGGDEKRFEDVYAENLADYRMGPRPPWKVQRTEGDS